jgi:hypothetical protein
MIDLIDYLTNYNFILMEIISENIYIIWYNLVIKMSSKVVIKCGLVIILILLLSKKI